jgi:hypothetical protein
LIALIEEAAVVGRILRHLGLPTEPPVPRPARAPPLVDGLSGVTGADDARWEPRARPCERPGFSVGLTL